MQRNSSSEQLLDMIKNPVLGLTGFITVEIILASFAYIFTSSCMMLVNEMIVRDFYSSCLLLSLQMVFSVAALTPAITREDFGSTQDVLKFLLVTPFFTGALLTQMWTLRHVSFSLILLYRAFAILIVMPCETRLPIPLRVDRWSVAAIAVLLGGTTFYVCQIPRIHIQEGLTGLTASVVFIALLRLAQRLTLGKTGHALSVNISVKGASVLNSVSALIMSILLGYFFQDFEDLAAVQATLREAPLAETFASCIFTVGATISGVWILRLMTATSFLVLVSAGNFVYCVLEVQFLPQRRPLVREQFIGAFVAMLGTFWWASVQWQRYATKLHKDEEVEEAENQPLLRVVTGGV